MREILDGTSKTIAIVESKRDIPWTKPEDIEIDPDPTKPLPKLGGHLQPDGTFVAVFADGSVQPVSGAVSPKTLREFFTVAGGELVNRDALNPPKPAEQKPAEGKLPENPMPIKQSMLNMLDINRALAQHHGAYKRFPAAIARDANGKPLLSWRVSILPFLDGGKELYQQFRLTEPWNSEHNRALIDKMPAVFRDPAEDPKSTNASYFMITGKGMFGDAEKGRGIREITDGTSKTILIVESKRDIPWTKPEDIEIDPDQTKPLPKFGGHLQPEGRFLASRGDGSVQPVEANVDPQSLREFFTVAGGEITEYAPKLLQAAPKADSHPDKPAVPAQGNIDDAAARQKTNVINLKKIGLALHNFASAEGFFPPPVVYSPDGKTKHSWRVAILPYIERHEVKTKYRFDEPWDSEHNRQVLAEMPEAFRSPFDAADSRNASYFMATGKDTFGYTEEGRKVDLGRRVIEITDGMEKTIMVVEAKRDVPWTKPEDIEIVPTQPLPKFGGFLPNESFNASFASGHVRTLSTSTDEKVLKALFTIDGGEAVDLKTLNQK